jgi:hypothetical protein
MKIKKDHIINMTKAANRTLELAVGRVNYNNVHRSKKAYNRQRDRKVLID